MPGLQGRATLGQGIDGEARAMLHTDAQGNARAENASLHMAMARHGMQSHACSAWAKQSTATRWLSEAMHGEGLAQQSRGATITNGTRKEGQNMAITDELREYAKSSDGVMYGAYQAILVIADRMRELGNRGGRMSRREEFVGIRAIDHMTSEGPCYAMWLTNEPIVRCRDCEHAQLRHPLNPITGIPAGIEDWRCDYFWNADELPEVEPNGFCAWGERSGG